MASPALAIAPFAPLRRGPEAPAVRILASRAEALDAATELARAWTILGPRIDRDGTVPWEATAALSRSGLLAITVPRAAGGAGLAVSDLIDVFVILAEADLALAQIGQNHFDFVDALVQAEPATRAFFHEELVRGARFGNALAEPGRSSRRDLATTIVETGGGDYRIDGRKFYATGALTADWVPVHAKAADGRILTAYVRRDAEGLTILEDWNAFGQRATFSGTVILDGVRVAREQVVDRASGDPFVVLAQFAGNQLIHPALEVGAARGALAAAAAFLGDAPAAADRLGALAVRTAAAHALVRRAARRVDEALATGAPSRDQALAAVIAVDEAKSLAYEIGPEATAAVLSADTPAAADAALRLDRLWRNSRTHSLHDPVRWRQHQVGDFHVNGQLAPDLAARFGLTTPSEEEKGS